MFRVEEARFLNPRQTGLRAPSPRLRVTASFMFTARPSSDLRDPVTDTSSSHILAERLARAAETEDWATFVSVVRDAGPGLIADLSLATMVQRVTGRLDIEALPQGFRPLRVAVLRNATLEPALPAVTVALVQRGFVPEFRLGDFDVYEPYAEGLGERRREHLAGADVAFVYWDPDQLAGDALFAPPDDFFEVLRARITAILEGLVERVDGSVIVANLAPAMHDAFGARGARDPHSWPQVARRLNLALADFAAARDSVAVLDLAHAVARLGVSGYRDARTYYPSRVAFSAAFAPRFATAFASTVAAALSQPRKCLVLDCDNTLWGGVLGEDGPEGVHIGTEYPGSLYRLFQLHLKALHGQGFLLALNSKNDEAEVLAFLRSSPDMVLREEHIATHRINWGDKAENIRGIAADLNIGIDSLIFIDDSDVECERVRQALPEVQVERFPGVPLKIPGFIDSLRGTEILRVTEDDLRRSESLRADIHRRALRERVGGYREFLESLGIELAIRCGASAHVERISQLTQRTNQFNLTTRRYSVAQLRAMLERDRVYTMAMRDRFSDYGTVGVAIVRDTERPGEAEIDSLLMSCRAFGRRIEETFLGVVLDDLAAGGVQRVTASYRPTERNAMVRDFFPLLGFEPFPCPAGEPGDAGMYYLLRLPRDPAAFDELPHAMTFSTRS